MKISTLPAAGSLTLNGAAVTAGQSVGAADLGAGKLVYAPAANASGTPYAGFTFQVQDNGGTANGGVDLDPTANTVTVNVAAVNDAPAGTNKAVSLSKDGSHTLKAADFGFTDPIDSPANGLKSVKIAALPAEGTLTLNHVLMSVGESINKADLDAGRLVFTPEANANGMGYASFGF